jgi:hypothetical protein
MNLLKKFALTALTLVLAVAAGCAADAGFAVG